MAYVNYECEIDNEHLTFIRKKSGKKYTELHHLIEAGVKSGIGYSKSGTSSVKTDFYVKPNGEIVPATGYRYMPAEASYMESLKNTMEIPANPSGTYIIFDKFDVPTPGRL